MAPIRGPVPSAAGPGRLGPAPLLARGSRMIQRVLVLGGGSAGFLAAISLKIKLPTLQVSVVRSGQMGVIGVGEATTFAFPNYLHGRLKIEPGDFHRGAQPTWKLGIRF